MKLEGMEALQRAVKEAPDFLRAGSSDNVRQSTWAVANRMRTTVSRHSRTGHLLTAIEAVVPVKTGLSGRVTIAGDAYYWKFLEYGTVNQGATPFIRPSTEVETQPFIGRFNALATRLEKWWAR